MQLVNLESGNQKIHILFCLLWNIIPKKKINKNAIYIIDIGANLGWFSFILGKKGYNILSFEPSKINYYILLKTYCLNNNLNITIVNKGLDKIESKSYLYHPFNNIGNALISKILKNYTQEEIILTKLNNYVDFYVDKNLALIKLDIECYEGRAIEGGIDFISKYHVPFIIMEFNPKSIKKIGFDPKIILEIFDKNGYKISVKNFLDKKYISKSDLLSIGSANIFAIYQEFLE